MKCLYHFGNYKKNKANDRSKYITSLKKLGIYGKNKNNSIKISIE